MGRYQCALCNLFALSDAWCEDCVAKRGRRELSTLPEKPRFPVTKLMAYGEGGSGGEPVGSSKKFKGMKYDKLFSPTQDGRSVWTTGPHAKTGVPSTRGRVHVDRVDVARWGAIARRDERGDVQARGHTRPLDHAPTTRLSRSGPPRGQRVRRRRHMEAGAGDTEDFARFRGAPQ